MPRAIVVAGPNGSGKSTLIAQLRQQTDFDFPSDYINADDIARNDIQGTQEEREHRAFLVARELRQQYREQGISHAFETVLSHPSGLLDLLRLRAAAFDLTFVYVTTDDPVINIRRVAGRVLRGGHNVPAGRIADRWERPLRFLPRAVETASQAYIYDSSGQIELVARAEQGSLFHPAPLSQFFQSRLEKPLRERAEERQQMESSLLPGEAITSPEEAAGVYSGSIWTILPHYCLQQISPTAVIRHETFC